MATFTVDNGQVLLAPADERALMKQLRLAGQTRNKAEIELMGSLITEPINTVAHYIEWANRLFVNKTVMPGEDWTIPVEEHNYMAFYSSPEGQIRRTRVGLQNVRPDFTRIGSGFGVNWDDLANASYDLIGRGMTRTGEEMARKRDEMAFSVLAAAAGSVNQVFLTTGGLLTRPSVDSILKLASTKGWTIRRVIANAATLQDMRTAEFFTWSSNKVPLAYGDSSLVQQIMTKGYLGNYGGAEFFETYGLSAGTTFGAAGSSLAAVASGQAVVIYVAEPTSLGFNVQRGGTRQLSESDIKNYSTNYYFDETRFYYVGNPYAVWLQIVTA